MRVQSLKASEPILGYTVTERIGAGGYGEVWKADAPGGLTKAIKFVYGFLDDDRASRELKALNRIKQVRHPFLLSLERIEVVDGQLIIVTELADMSLKDRHEQCKAAGLVGIPRSELLTYMHDAADALDYMRESFSLQHLDVKPENLLLVGGRVKVADFGLVKDIHDKTASLMGGLTPVYAPPEVFDDRPSHFSDQYSLAIVYQELLTDVLPFPGRTAAQLAAQHLQSRPRLGPLPPSDQAVIARSLSKEPEKRYPSCRGMVDALMEVGSASTAHPSSSSGGGTAIAEPEADTASAAVCATLPSMRPPPVSLTDHPVTQPRQDAIEARRAGPPLSAPIPKRSSESAPCLTEVRGPQAPKPRSTTVLPARLSTPRPRVAPVITELPPIDVPTAAAALRPTLFLGIGGTGASTLVRLRQRLHDRLGGLEAAPAFGLMLLDTDLKALHLATQGEEGAALTLQETLALPLRRTEEYRAGSAQLLQWMSRRWLYNIPRSLQTEGLRPLGRLAFVDHAAELFNRLQGTLATIASPEALKTTAERTGLNFSNVTPRVFIISSIAGGTGSGMVLDVAYAVRKILADLGQPENSVYGVLTHSTGRKAATRDLAIANSYACLSELHHYSSVSPFPGEPACGLPAAEDGDTTFSQTYLLDLGEDLTESEFRKATDTVAEYLFLNAATPTSAFFDQCRSQSASAQPSDDGPLLRSFGIARLGCSHEVPTTAANSLCRSLLERWSGEVRRPREEQPVRRLGELPGMPSPAPEPVSTGFLRDSEIDRLANDNAAKLNLDVDHVIMELYEAVERELGSDAESYVCRVVASLAAAQEKPDAPSDHAPRTTQVLTEINVLLGCQSAEEDLGRPPTASLQTVLDDHLRKLAAGYGAAIRDWVVELVDVPAVRVKGAYRATEWFATHLRSMKQIAGDMLAQTQEDAAAKQEELLESKMRYCLRESRDGKPALDLRFQQYARLRFLEIALTGVRRLAQLVSSHVSSVGDVLKEARRELGRLAEDFCTDADLPKSMSDDAPHAADTIAAKIGADVTRLLPELAAQLDQQLQAQFVAANGGLCAVLSKLTELRRPLLRSLRFEARTAVLNRLSHMGVAKEILDPGSGEGDERYGLLRASLTAATPKLLSCGGAKRLMLATSDEGAAGPLKEILNNEMHEQVSLAPGTAGDVVLCYEVEQVPLEVAAVTLVEENSEYAQIAARLHTRVDVAWRPLAQPGVDTL